MELDEGNWMLGCQWLVPLLLLVLIGTSPCKKAVRLLVVKKVQSSWGPVEPGEPLVGSAQLMSMSVESPALLWLNWKFIKPLVAAACAVALRKTEPVPLFPNAAIIWDNVVLTELVVDA